MPNSFVFDRAKADFLNSGASWNWYGVPNYYVLLVSGNFAGTNNLSFESDVTGWEIVATNYSRKRLNSLTIYAFNTIDYFAADPMIFTGINNCTVGGIVVFNSGGGNPAVNKLLCYLSGNKLPLTCNGQPFTIDFSVSGMFLMSGG